MDHLLSKEKVQEEVKRYRTFPVQFWKTDLPNEKEVDL